MNWLFFRLLSLLGDGQVLVRQGKGLAGANLSDVVAGAGDLLPEGDDTREIGAADHRYRAVHVGTGGVVSAGDLDAGGGYRQIVPFGRADVAAGSNATASASTPVQVGFGANGAVLAGWVAPRAGSLTALSAALSGAAAGSDCLVGVYKNGTLIDATGIVTLASATSDVKARTTFAKDTAGLTFVAGDVIDVRIRTGTGWSATTVDLAVAVEIEC